IVPLETAAPASRVNPLPQGWCKSSNVHFSCGSGFTREEAIAEGPAYMTYTLDDLLHLMARLRDPQHGCPWDLQQDYASIVPHTLEEAYEVADTIERGDFEHLQGELGDLLFQVVYYSQLAREEGRFEFAGVVDAITRKLIRRHPHVFPTGDLYAPLDTPRLSEAQVKSRWEAIKAEERAEKAAAPKQLSLLDDVPAV